MNSRQIIEDTNKNGWSYHKLTFPDGTVLNGIWDMSKYLEHFQIPEDLNGKTVLEIGPGSGFFSFEFAKRGAKRVVAIDIKPNKIQQASNELMGTNVEFITKDLFTLDENFGKFDLVFCSNVVIHVSDVFKAIQKMQEVSSNQVILCNSVLKNPKFTDEPVAYFLGKLGVDGSILSYWQPTMLCLQRMLEKAKFSNINEISTFMEISEDEKIKNYTGVFHAFV